MASELVEGPRSKKSVQRWIRINHYQLFIRAFVPLWLMYSLCLVFSLNLCHGIPQRSLGLLKRTQGMVDYPHRDLFIVNRDYADTWQ